MSLLPELANVVAIRSMGADIGAVEARVRTIVGSPARLARCDGDWLVAVAPLGGGPVPEVLTSPHGAVIVAEGSRHARDIARRHGPSDLRALGKSSTADIGLVALYPDGTASVMRSVGGRVPWYIHHRDDQTIVGTLLSWVGALAPSPSVDEFALATWLGGALVFPDGRTPIRDVAAVPRGYAADLEPGQQLKLRRYWDAASFEVEPATEEVAIAHAAGLRDLILSYLKDELPGNGGSLLALSGGVDSASLAILIRRHLDLPLGSVSFVPSRDAEPELAYVQPLIDDFGLSPASVLELTGRRIVDDLEQAPKLALPVRHPVLNALPGLVGPGRPSVYLGGEFADDICGSALTWPDWAASLGPAGVLGQVIRGPHETRSLGRWAKLRARHRPAQPLTPFRTEMSSFFRPDLREEYREWRARTIHEVSDGPWERFYLRGLMATDGWLAMNWETCSHLYVRRATPFFQRGVLELALRTDPRLLLGPGTKRLLRRAFDDLVPSRYLYRPDKGRWTGFDIEISDLQGSTARQASTVFVRGAETLAEVTAATGAQRLREWVDLRASRV